MTSRRAGTRSSVPDLEVFVNDARTTTFLALRVGTASPIDPSPGTSPGTAANASRFVEGCLLRGERRDERTRVPAVLR